MGYGKYTKKGSEISKEIQKLRNRQHKIRKQWIEIDIKIINLKHLLQKEAILKRPRRRRRRPNEQRATTNRDEGTIFKSWIIL